MRFRGRRCSGRSCSRGPCRNPRPCTESIVQPPAFPDLPWLVHLGRAVFSGVAAQEFNSAQEVVSENAFLCISKLHILNRFCICGRHLFENAGVSYSWIENKGLTN